MRGYYDEVRDIADYYDERPSRISRGHYDDDTYDWDDMAYWDRQPEFEW